eukprot:CAMPEP_0116063652 /NCGR_PEP_ID=MMETSP0322-20121206/8560_1 /TAXON_ID=163516 /ORGANISM="Leptocylindrus danicus var. apora, Strain B651" /LENGTH=311 /DNA_ID=CAMNT_0003549347 /DNA_START=39 /DNA_END=971 /DNA_ORIENTATION=+
MIMIRTITTKTNQLFQSILPHLHPTHYRTIITSSHLKNFASEWNLNEQSRRIEMSQRLFRAAEYRALNRYWFTYGQVPNEFRARHGMLTLYVWMLHKRLMRRELLLGNDNDKKTQQSENEVPLEMHEARLIQEELFDILWNDTKARIRAESGISELMVNKYLKDVQEITYQNCFLLDDCFHSVGIGDDDGDSDGSLKERRERLGNILYNFVYLKRDDVPSMLIRRMVEFVEEEYENVAELLPEEYFSQGRIGWLEYFPNLDDLVSDDGVKLPNVVDAFENDPEYLPANWRKALTDSGDAYYWNMDNFETTW